MMMKQASLHKLAVMMISGWCSIVFDCLVILTAAEWLNCLLSLAWREVESRSVFLTC